MYVYITVHTSHKYVHYTYITHTHTHTDKVFFRLCNTFAFKSNTFFKHTQRLQKGCQGRGRHICDIQYERHIQLHKYHMLISTYVNSVQCAGF